MAEGAELPAAWEAAKENIQPLRRGRNIAQLTEALTMGPAMLEEKKREFEEALRAYEGDDPLEVWDSYLTWLEEHYPSGLHGIHLPQLLENCISAFIADPNHRYDNDPRFVRIWLKFAGLQVHPEEVYKCMSARGVGVGSAAFYMEWADFHELSGEPRVAQEILEKGVQMLAQPQEQVRSALRDLILRLAQGSTRPQEEPQQEDYENSRTALSRLRLERKNEAPIIRIGRNRMAHDPGALPQTQPNRAVPVVTGKSTNRTKIAVFDEASASTTGDSLFAGMGSLAGSASQSHKLASEKENLRKAKKMAREKIAQNITPRPGPAFEIVPDESADDSISSSSVSTKSRPHAVVGSVLSTRKNVPTEMTLTHILAPDINEKRMYDFLAVYAGTSEFQFEEIRLARYKKHLKDLEQQKAMENATEQDTDDEGDIDSMEQTDLPAENTGLSSEPQSPPSHSLHDEESNNVEAVSKPPRAFEVFATLPGEEIPRVEDTKPQSSDSPDDGQTSPCPHPTPGSPQRPESEVNPKKKATFAVFCD